MSVTEAAQYYGVGENRLRDIIKGNPNAEFLLSVGTKTLFKRKLFEKFLDETSAL